MIDAEDVVPSASRQELAAGMWFIQTRKKSCQPKQDREAIRTCPNPPLLRSEVTSIL